MKKSKLSKVIKNVDKNVDDENDDDDDDDFETTFNLNSQWKVLNGDIWWHAFLFASNQFSNELIRKTFEEIIDTNLSLYLNARFKIFDYIKIHKNQVFARMKIFTSFIVYLYKFVFYLDVLNSY